MNRRLWRCTLGAVAVFLCAGLCTVRAETDFQGGRAGAGSAALGSAEQSYANAEKARKAGDEATAQKWYATAFKELAPLAKQGNAQAQVRLGRMYLMGYGVLKDSSGAYRLFNAAARQGNADGEFYVGAKAVLSRKGVASGLEYLRLSAEQGNQDAQLLLGQTYLQGIPGAVRPDPVQADMWLRLAARNNLPFYTVQLESAERQMNAAQIAKGKALAEAWKPKQGLRPPADMAH